MTTLTFYVKSNTYVATYTSEGLTMIHMYRGVAGTVEVYIGLGAVEPAYVGGYDDKTTAGNKSFLIAAPAGATVKIISSVPVRKAYCMYVGENITV